MFSSFFPTLFCALGAGLLLVAPGGAQEPHVPPPSPGETAPAAPAMPAGADVEARGPVHEAFAQPSDVPAAPPPVVPKEPPPAVEESPPEQKPQGAAVWLPGYWAWDHDRADYLWVSGFWRTPPPGRQWVPGSWQQAPGGWRWTHGFWHESGQEEVQYLPPPPRTIDNGPSTPAPAGQFTYVPGSWIYRETRYLWRPGFWVRHRPDWVWFPDHYQWTPAGYIFVPGFWDYPLHERGLLFAPVFFPRRVLTRERLVYTPSHVVELDFLISALFVRRGGRHYYFGDYFGKRHEKHYIPWVDYRATGHAHDVHFAYYRHAFAGHEGWEGGLRRLYAARYAGEVPRPPRTLVQQAEVINNITVNQTANFAVHKDVNITNTQNVRVLAPIAKVNHVHVTALAGLGHAGGPAPAAPPIHRRVPIEKVGSDRLAEERQVARHYSAVGAERNRHETRLVQSAAGPVRPTDQPARVKFNLPKAPDRLAGPPAKAAPPPPKAPPHKAHPAPKDEAPHPSRAHHSAARHQKPPNKIKHTT
jgi:hypothetical protein